MKLIEYSTTAAVLWQEDLAWFTFGRAHKSLRRRCQGRGKQQGLEKVCCRMNFDLCATSSFPLLQQGVQASSMIPIFSCYDFSMKYRNCADNQNDSSLLL